MPMSYSGSPSLWHENVGAGQIALAVRDAPSGPSRAMMVWCTDIFDALYTPATYNIGLLTNNRGTARSAAEHDRPQPNQCPDLPWRSTVELGFLEQDFLGHSAGHLVSRIRLRI